MKIELIVRKDCNDMEVHEVIVDDKDVASIRDLSECPEDAHIGRDLIDGRDIIRFIQLGYEKGKAGEEIEIMERFEEDDEG